MIPTANRVVLPGCNGVPLPQILKHFSDRELWTSAKALSFSFIMALPPMLIFFFTLIPYFPVDGVQTELLRQLEAMLPSGVYDRVSSTINDVIGHKHSSLLSIGFIGSVILAANGIYGLLQSFNSVSHSIESRSVVKLYLLCLLLVVVLYVMVVAILSLLIGYKLIIQFLISQNYIAESKLSLVAFSVGRWLLLVFLTLLALSLLYYLAPVKKQRINFFSIGSVLSTLLIFGLSWAFQIYISNFNNYNLLYGSIGTILILMLWVYANCVVILAGYAVNIAIADSLIEERKPLVRQRRRKTGHGTTLGGARHYRLSTENASGRQPRGSELFHSPSGVGKWRKVISD